jgi:UDP-N-acetylmuramoylalanine--D-glutamate ligase
VITSTAFRGKRYAVLGLARSGRATVEALVASGAEVTAWDEKADAREAIAALFPGEGRGPVADSDLDPGLRRGTIRIADPLEIDLAGYDGVIVSPGVPLNRHPIAAKARDAGVPVVGDIELFAQARGGLPPHKVVGITGTNGKSTTTALVHHILKTAGVPATMGGNIGLPILAQEPLPEGGVYVLELSSYQIDLTFSLDCDVAVLLNVTPDHLDRYESFEAYAASKARLFEMQSAGQHAYAGSENGVVPKVAGDWGAIPVEVDELEPALFGAQSEWPALQGPHNKKNAAAARITAFMTGLVSAGDIREGLRTYPGLPHRMERVAEKGGVLFVNDSKATNADSTAPALAAYPNIHWIVGGRAKTEDLGPCEAQLGHVRAAYAIGESGPLFVRLLEGKVPAVEQSGTLDKAVKSAAGAAKAGEVVLLSPACASFDQFRDYEHRGQAFRDAVEALGA